MWKDNRTGLICATVLALSAAPVAGEEPVLEEILVTADKVQARSAQDTPIAMAVIGGSDIEEQGFTDMSSLLRQTPGVTVSELAPGLKTLTLRGIASDTSGDTTVGYYLDDMPFNLPPLNLVPDINPYDLDNVVVLRGPQGTLYGASSMGGTVRITTHEPVHGEVSGKATAGYSFTDEGGDNYKVQGALNIPLIDEMLSARVAFSQVERDGFIDLPLTGEDNHNDFEDTAYRVKVRFTPSDFVEIRASHWVTRQNAAINFSDDDLNFSPVNLVTDFNLVPTGDFQPVPGEALKVRADYDLTNVNITVVLDDFTMYGTFSTMDFEWDSSWEFFSTTPGRFINDFESESAEIRLAYTGSDRWSATVGGFYSDTEGDVDWNGAFLFAGLPRQDVLFADIVRGSEQMAVFGEVHFFIVPELELTLGGRYFEDERFETDNPGTPTATFLPFLGYDLTRSRTFDATTFRVNLSYTPNEQSLYYVNVGEGFRSGQTQCGACLLSGLAPAFSIPEELLSYEVGAKLVLFERALTLDLAFYYWEWEEITLALLEFAADGTIASYFANVGDADAMGVDIGATYSGVEGLTLSLVANFGNSEYKDDLPLAGISSGDRTASTPDYSLTATADYEWPLTPRLNGRIYASYITTDSIKTYSRFLPGLPGDKISYLNARAGVATENWTLLVTAENLLNDTDEIVNFGSFILLGGAPARQAPRTVGLEFTVNF